MVHRVSQYFRSPASQGPSRLRAERRDGFARPVGAIEPLEERRLMAVSLQFEGLVNASRFPLNQTETAIAVNRVDTNKIFLASNQGGFVGTDEGPNDPINESGLFVSRSSDNGTTWTPRLIAADADGNGVSDDGFPIACCDPSVSYDEFGNLFLAYLAINPLSGVHSVVVLTSSDDGQTFTQIGDFHGEGDLVDRCEVTAAHGMVWVSFVDFLASSSANPFAFGSEMAVGAPVTGLGQIGQFITPQQLPQSGPASGGAESPNLGHINIGPNGEVMATYQSVESAQHAKIYVNTDPDGLGPAPFGNAVFVDDTQVGAKETIPGQPERGLSAVPTLAYDRSTGPHRGRVYITYTQEVSEDRTDSIGRPIGATGDTDVVLRYSDDNGAAWSPGIRVNDDPVTTASSQFLQRVAVDPVTGAIAVGWLDSRDNASGPGADQQVGYYLTVGRAAGNGVDFAPNVRLNVGASNARLSGNFGNDYGDYTGLDFYNSVVWAAYPDNSNSTRDNPAGALRAFDDYAARVRLLPDTTPAEPPFVTAASPLSPTPVKPVTLVKKGKFYNMKVSYTNPSGINLSTLGDNDLLVTGPNGFSQAMQFLKAARKAKGTNVIATYRLPAPGGKWEVAENGVYTVTLAAGSVAATNGTVTDAGTLNKFVVNVPTKTGKQNRREIDEQWSHYRPHHGPTGESEEEREEREHEGLGGDDDKRDDSATSLLEA